MKTNICTRCFLVFLICESTFSYGQKRKIIINNDLLLNSKELKVKYKQHKNKMEFSCADYKIVNSEINKGKIEEDYLPGSMEQSKHSEFWFLMENGADQTIKVYSTHEEKSKFEDKSEFLDILTGEDDTYEWTSSEIFHKVTLTTSLDTADQWVLNEKHLHNVDIKECNLTLTNGMRTIEVIDAKPTKGGAYYWTSPAAGFEFIENKQTIAAYQSQGGAAIGLGSRQQLIWLRNDLDDETRLLLIAVMAVFRLINTKI